MTDKKHILVIPDAHAHPDYDNDRFDVLGDYIARHRPDMVMSIGDWADMASICEHSSKLSLEGKRYPDDCESVVDSQERMFSHVGGLNIDWQMVLGNHDARIDKLAAQNPQLEGVISMDDLRYEDFGWTVHPFRKVTSFFGWHFSHYFPTGVSGRPISGPLAAKALVQKNHESCVQGHSHLVGWHSEATPSGKRIHGVVVGCYSSIAQIEDWNQNTEFAWWRGVVHIHGAKDGDGGIQFVPGDLMEDNAIEHAPPTVTVEAPPVGWPHPRKRGKLSDADVRFIRKSQDSTVALGARFSLDPSTISKIRKFKRYANVI